MGTRHLIIVKYANKVKVAQYGQWDGYPTGQGTDIAVFLKKINKPTTLKAFKKKVARLQFMDDAAVSKLWDKFLPVKYATSRTPDELKYVSMDVANKFYVQYPELSREAGANVLNMINDGKVLYLMDSSLFLKDKLFCEYAYEIDLTKKKVTVYTGGEHLRTYKFSEFTSAAMKKLEKDLSNDN